MATQRRRSNRTLPSQPHSGLPTSGARSARAAWHGGLFQRRDAALLLAPAGVLFVVLYLAPLVLTGALAFTDWHVLRSAAPRFNGLQNVADLLADGTIGRTIPTTVIFALSVTVIQNVVGLALALAIEPSSRVTVVFRTILMIPVLVSALAAGYVWRNILDPLGPLNQIISTLTGIPFQVGWLGSITMTIFVASAIQAWKGYPITMLIYLAGLRAIPTDLVESARIDGASGWQVFRQVKLPLLAPSVTLNVALTFISSFSAFDVLIAATKGGPARTTEVVNFVVYQATSVGRLGYATMMSLSLYLAVLVVGIPLIVYLRRREIQL